MTSLTIELVKQHHVLLVITHVMSPAVDNLDSNLLSMLSSQTPKDIKALLAIEPSPRVK